MKVKESLKQGKHTSKKFFIIEFICIVVIILSVFIMSDRIEKEKPNATDLSQNGAIGTEAGKYVYLQIDGLSDEIAIGPDDEKYYVAINDGVGYIVSLSSVELEELNNIHEYTYGNIENRPASVNVYGITKEVPDDLKQIAIDFFNEGLDDEQKITVDQFEDYFGSVLLDTSENPVDVSLELILVLISVITLFVTIIIQICNKVIRIKTFKYLEKNSYEKELEKINFNMENAEGKIKVIKNIDGTIYKKTDNIRQILASHIINPVRFDKAIELMKSEGIEQYLEIGPGKALTGFIKKS